VSVVLALIVGAVTAQLLRMGAASMLAHPALQRRNLAGRLVPTSGGILIVLTVLVVEAGRVVLGALGIGDVTDLNIERSSVLFAVFGFGLLGFLDDILGDSSATGFRGHIARLFHGDITTGFLKLFGGAGIAVLLVANPGFITGRRLLIDAVLIALAANLGNLLDRAPGRTLKFALVAYIPLALVLGDGAVGVAIAPAMGAAFGLFPADVREKLMLGDAGANVVGAVLGLGVVLGRGEVSRTTALIVLLVANVAAEVISFSKIIERIPPLRAFDRLGRLPRQSDPADPIDPTDQATS